MRRLPCRWDAKRIVVLDEVHIEEPYTTEACKGANAMAVDRVRKVVRSISTPTPFARLLTPSVA